MKIKWQDERMFLSDVPNGACFQFNEEKDVDVFYIKVDQSKLSFANLETGVISSAQNQKVRVFNNAEVYVRGRY